MDFLKQSGCWPDTSLAAKIYCALVQILLELYVGFLVMQLLNCKNIEDLSFVTNMLLTSFMNVFKSLNVMWNLRNILELFRVIDRLIDDWWMQPEHISKFQSRVLRGNKVIEIYKRILLATALTGLVPPFFTGNLFNEI